MDRSDQLDNMQRRIFVKGVGSVTLGFIAATMFGGCEAILEKIRNRPIRRRLRTGSAAVDNDIAIYRDAVAQMRALPNSDPRSWFAQTGIHGTTAGGFNLCQHGTNHFFSWHRAYLLFFERICQKLTGEPKFALPYWNWNQNPDVHPSFLDSTSSLFEASRARTSVAGVSNFTDETLNPIFADSNFFTFASQIETTPHNRGHTHIGGIMGGGGSAGDPLFWMHHCMVDYCWAKWNIELDNDNTNDSTWLGTSWNHFVDGNGNPASSTAGLTTLMPLLSYQYECSRVGQYGCPLNLSALSKIEFDRLKRRIEKGAKVTFDIRKTIPVSRGAKIFINQPVELSTSVKSTDFSAIIDTDTSRERIFLRLRYADLPEKNDFFVRVFINLPSANAETSIKSDHFAGTFSFFGTKTAQHGSTHRHEPGFLINVTDTIRKLRTKNLLRQGQPLTLKLVAIPEHDSFARPDVSLELKNIELIISPLHIRAR